MKEYQIIVTRIYDGSLWYTAQERTVRFLYRGSWRDITPTHQPNIKGAEYQIEKIRELE
jgi:hypothetical protein